MRFSLFSHTSSSKSTARTVTISPSTIIFTIALILGIYFFYQVRSVLLLIFSGFLISVALTPLVRFFAHKLRFPRKLAVGSSFLIFISMLVAFSAVVLPPLLLEAYALLRSADLPLPELERTIKELNFSVQEIGDLLDRVTNSAGFLFQAAGATFHGLLMGITLLVIAFYFLLEGDRMHLRLQWFTKDAKKLERGKHFFAEVESQLGGWTRGQFILMAIVGVLNYIGLSLLGVPYALPLAMLAGLFEIIPNVGPFLAGIAAAIVSLTFGGPMLAVAALVLATVIQQIESDILTPNIMSVHANVSPLMALIVILLGLQIEGILGALLAIPSYLVFRTAYSVFVRQDA